MRPPPPRPLSQRCCRAEVSDISIAVREGTDAIMLSGKRSTAQHGWYWIDDHGGSPSFHCPCAPTRFSPPPPAGETAYGRFPFKALDTMTTVARRTELSTLRYQVGTEGPPTPYTAQCQAGSQCAVPWGHYAPPRPATSPAAPETLAPTPMLAVPAYF